MACDCGSCGLRRGLGLCLEPSTLWTTLPAQPARCQEGEGGIGSTGPVAGYRTPEAAREMAGRALPPRWRQPEPPPRPAPRARAPAPDRPIALRPGPAPREVTPGGRLGDAVGPSNPRRAPAGQRHQHSITIQLHALRRRLVRMLRTRMALDPEPGRHKHRSRKSFIHNGFQVNISPIIRPVPPWHTPCPTIGQSKPRTRSNLQFRCPRTAQSVSDNPLIPTRYIAHQDTIAQIQAQIRPFSAVAHAMQYRSA